MIKTKISGFLNENKITSKLEHPSVEKFGDYAVRGDVDFSNLEIIEKVDKVAGFSNLWIKENILVDSAKKIISDEYKNELKEINKNKQIMVEFAHPNTHKELHIGHMRTLVTGESLARIFECLGAVVFRANYQGDIGPHVAKAIYGVSKLVVLENKTILDWEKESNSNKAHFLGRAYALGCADYEENKDQIDLINQKLYSNDPEFSDIYKITRAWSLNYYNDFYNRFYTKFDKLFFESEISNEGKNIVMENVGKIFEKGENEAIIFDGEKFGLHKRVFVTGQGTVTYEGKEMALALAQRKEFEFDKNIHVVANEQAGYFKVVIKAIELLDPWFVNREYHLSMGMVSLTGRKMSSRTGDVVTVDSILDETKEAVLPLIKNEEIDKTDASEKITIGAVKFSVLRSDPTANTVFDVAKAIDLTGNSGTYLQYTYARAQSVVNKSSVMSYAVPAGRQELPVDEKFDENERELLRYFYIFEEKIVEAGERYSPAVLAEYLLNLARKFNEFYAKCKIVGEPEEARRVFLTQVTAKIIKDGLSILGIETLEKM